MRNILFLCSIVLLLSQRAYARPYNNGDRDSIRLKNVQPPQESRTLRSFPELDKYLQENNRQVLNVPNSTIAEFTQDFISTNYPISDIVADNRSQAAQTFAEIDRQGRYIDYLSPSDLVELPVGMKKRLGSTNVTIGVAKAKFTSTYSELTIFCKIDLPQGKTIFFGADKVKLSNSGGIFGDARLVLLGNFQIPINGGNSMIILKGLDLKDLNMSTGDVNSQVYSGITVTCNGVKDFGVAADIVFPRSLIEPVDDNFNVISDQSKKVVGSFFTKVEDWNNLYVSEVSLSKFAIHGLSKVCFSLDKATFDFSDTNNPDLPSTYGNKGIGNLWRGVFIKNIKVYLPKEFKKKNTSDPNYENGRVTITGKEIIIDNWGFTGSVSAENVFQDGNASGWDFSVDKFEINVQANSLRGASFQGSIAIPLTQKPNNATKVEQYGLRYAAIFTADNGYMMNVGLTNSIKFDLWKAQATLEKGSYIELVARDNVFRPKAVLNGSMNVLIAQNDKTDADLNGITFNGLVLQTESPYFSLLNGGGFGYTQTTKRVSNFPIIINKVYFTPPLALTVDFDLHLMDAGNFSFSAHTDLQVIGKTTTSNDGSISYDYDKLLLNAINIDGDFGGFSLKGGIQIMRDHPKMGNGFAGDVEMTIKLKKNNKTTVKVAAAFGSTITETPFRYWYVDALASIPPVSIAPGLDIVGFGGGASYKMKKTTEPIITPFSITGSAYIPDPNIGLGLRAMVSLAIKGETGHADACLEMTFKSGGGLDRIGLFGRAEIMPPKELTTAFQDPIGMKQRLNSGLTNFTNNLIGNEGTFNNLISAGNFNGVASNTTLNMFTPTNATSTIVATLGIEYDFNTETLTGNFDAKMDANGHTLTGDGKMRLKFAPNRWYIYIGEPDPAKRFKINMSAGGLTAKLDAYFVVGDSLPASPPPPAQVVNILGNRTDALNYMRDLNALSSGGGFAFGASLAAGTGDLNFLIFYANFNAGIGFDIMVKKYPNTTYNCSGTTGNLGMNGWYANGQAYAYMQGTLGVKVGSLRIPIVKGGAAMLLQAKLPNPSWFAGYMAGNYSVLGGTIKGSFNMKITFGKDCELNTTSLTPEISFIQEISPSNQSTGIDITATPQVTFRQSVNTPFYLPKEDPLNSADAYDTYRAFVDANSFKVTKQNAPNIAISGQYKLNENSDTYTFESTNLLEPNTTYQIMASTKLQKLTSDSGPTEVWEDVPNSTESKTTTFTTAAEQQGIPLSNIEYSYPAIGQKYFHPGEHPKGYIKLRKGLPQISNNPSKKLVVLISSNQYYQSWRDATFNNNTIEFNLPSDDFTNDTMTLTVFQIDENTNCVGLRSNSTGGHLTDLPPVHFLLNGLECGNSILSYKFSTSKYKTFTEKMTAKFSNPIHSVQYTYTNLPLLNAKGISDEPFELEELNGITTTNNKPLIQAEANLSNPYYTNNIKNLLYSWTHNSNYPTDFSFRYLNEKITDFEPVRTVVVSPAYLSALTNTEILSSNDKPVFNNILAVSLPFQYAAAKYYQEDLEEAIQYVYFKYVYNCGTHTDNRGIPTPGCIPTHLEPVYNAVSLPTMPTGSYSVNFKYVLPNGIVTSVYPFTFNYSTSSGSGRN